VTAVPARLARYLEPDSATQQLARRLRDAGHRAYLVGGSVRDAFLDRTSVDDDRMAARDALVVEAQVGREAPPDVGHGLVQRDEPRDLAVLDGQVAAGRRTGEGQALAARAVAQDAVGLELLGRRVNAGGRAGRCAGHGRHLIAWA